MMLHMDSDHYMLQQQDARRRYLLAPVTPHKNLRTHECQSRVLSDSEAHHSSLHSRGSAS